MKIERALLNYLIKNKRLPLPGIGVFELQGSVPDRGESNRAVILPEGGIEFTQTPVMAADEELIQFVSEQTGKIKPLAESDLDSYLMLGRQFINLGNPFIIAGIGSLEKDKSGKLYFRQGAWVAEKLDNEIKSEIRDETAEPTPENSIDDFQRRGSKNRSKTILIAVGILLLALILWAVWRFGFNDDTAKDTSATPAVNIDTNAAIQTQPADTFATIATGFKIIVNEYASLASASKRYNDLTRFGRNVVLFTNDSLTYYVAENFDLPLSDTTKMKDSLRGYYGAAERTVIY